VFGLDGAEGDRTFFPYSVRTNNCTSLVKQILHQVSISSLFRSLLPVRTASSSCVCIRCIGSRGNVDRFLCRAIAQPRWGFGIVNVDVKGSALGAGEE
jgi:hypothetical protein